MSGKEGGLNRIFPLAQVLVFFAEFCLSFIPVRMTMILLFCGMLAPCMWAADRPTVFADGQLSIDLPDGWSESRQNQANSDSVGGWESSDRKTSLYVLRLRLVNQGDEMRAALDRTIENLDRDENWLLRKTGEYRQITIQGLPATYARVELDLRSGSRTVPFVFHLAMVGGANSFYLLQGSVMKPVWQVREDEVIRMIKSFQVLKEE